MTRLTVLTSILAFIGSSFGVDARVIGREPNVIAKRLEHMPRDVVNPPITYPTTGTVWNVGEQHNVTWDTSVIPPGFTSNGMLVLGFLDDDDPNDTNEHLDLDHPLAQNFPITAGRAEITVPAVQTRNTYILVLFGDSGNASGKFTIKNISIGGPGSTSSVASSTVTATTTALTTSSPAASSSSAASSSADSTTSDDDTTSRTATSSSGAPSSTVAASTSGQGLTSTAPASSASNTVTPAPSSPTTQGSVAEQTAATTTASNGASAHTVAFGGLGAWMSAVCSLTLVLGWTL